MRRNDSSQFAVPAGFRANFASSSAGFYYVGAWPTSARPEAYRFKNEMRRAPSGHPDGCPVRICLILLCRAWSKLDVQVVVCNWVGDPFKAWVAGSSPAALTISFNGLRVGI